MSALSALQTTLSAEHAAVHVFALYGARTSQSQAPQLYAALVDGYRDHRSRRDQLRLMVADLGARPVAAGAAYDVPTDLRGTARIAAAALATERACAATYAALVADTVATQRRWAATALSASALLELRLGGAPSAFPGAPELG